jgi:hypothetical protein
MVKNNIFYKVLMWFVLSIFIFSFVSHKSIKKAFISKDKLISSIYDINSANYEGKKSEVIYCWSCLDNLPQDHKKIITNGTAQVPIKNSDVASARRIAIALAIRDAVEKGYGFYVELNNLPNRREILQSAAAQVAYSIIEEKEKDNYYEITIEAEILVPVDLIDEFPAAPPSSEIPSGYEPFIAKHPHGEINWGEGYVIAEGLAAIQKGDTPEQVELLSKRAALIDAEANILEIIYNIRVDSENMVRDAVEKNKDIFFKVEGIIQGAEAVEELKLDNMYKVKIKVPITGIKGLGIACYQLTGKEAPLPLEKPVIKPEEQKKSKAAKPASDELTGFAGAIINTSETDFEACLYPKIVTEQGMEVYSVQQVSKDSLIEKGMASYAVVIEKGSQPKEEDLLLIARQWQSRWIRWAGSHAQPIYYSTVAASTPSPLRDIFHSHGQPLIIKASRAEGRMKGTIVITQPQGEKLIEMDKESGLLKECNIIIVVPVSENKDTKSNSSDLKTFQTLYMGMH